MPKLGAKAKIRAFLLANIGRIVSKNELANAAGEDVTEWARRVRELREDEGWKIITNNDSKAAQARSILARMRTSFKRHQILQTNFRETPR